MTAFSSIRVAVFLGWRAIVRGNRGTVALTVILMAAIFAELLFVPSLIEGATNQIELELRQTVTANIAVRPVGSELTIPHPAALAGIARKIPGVQAVTSTMLVGSQITHGNLSNSWPVVAIDPKSYAQTFTTPRSMIEGKFLDASASDEIVLGVGIAGAGRKQESTYYSSLENVHVGDRVTVTLRGGRTHVFRVQGIYRTNLTQANTTAFISAATAAKLDPPLMGVASAIYIRTDHLGDEQAIIDQIRHVRHDVLLQSWQTLAAAVKDITGSFNVIKSILNAVSLFVAAITVFIVTYVDLVNRRRTMGIERAIGVSGLAITASYEIKAVAFAVSGVIFGIAIYFGAAIPLVRRYPFQFPIGPVVISVTSQELQRDAVILVVVAVIGALVPAWHAVRSRLLDAIWG